jgi:hypothetical protein
LRSAGPCTGTCDEPTRPKEARALLDESVAGSCAPDPCTGHADNAADRRLHYVGFEQAEDNETGAADDHGQSYANNDEPSQERDHEVPRLDTLRAATVPSRRRRIAAPLRTMPDEPSTRHR